MYVSDLSLHFSARSYSSFSIACFTSVRCNTLSLNQVILSDLKFVFMAVAAPYLRIQVWLSWSAISQAYSYLIMCPHISSPTHPVVPLLFYLLYT